MKFSKEALVSEEASHSYMNFGGHTSMYGFTSTYDGST